MVELLNMANPEDKLSWETESKGQLKTLYKDGKFYMNTTLTQIKEKLKETETVSNI